MRGTPIRGAVYGLLAAAIWGGMYVVSDVVLAVIPPFTLLTIRLILGAVVLLVIRWRTGNTPWPNGREALRLMGVGFVGFGVSVGAQFVGTDLSTAINGALVTSASPAFILIFAAMILRERLTMQRIAAVGLATIGVLFIIDLSQVDLGSENFQGNVVLAVAALTWGLYSVLVRKVSMPSASGQPQTDTLTVTLLAFVGGMLLTIPAALIELQNRPVGNIDGGVILGILYLGVVSTAGAMWLWNRSFALVDASVASLFFFAQPLVGAILSVALLDQQMTLNLWLGGLLIAGGVLLSLYPLERLRARRQVANAIETGD